MITIAPLGVASSVRNADRNAPAIARDEAGLPSNGAARVFAQKQSCFQVMTGGSLLWSLRHKLISHPSAQDNGTSPTGVVKKGSTKTVTIARFKHGVS